MGSYRNDVLWLDFPLRKFTKQRYIWAQMSGDSGSHTVKVDGDLYGFIWHNEDSKYNLCNAFKVFWGHMIDLHEEQTQI